MTTETVYIARKPCGCKAASCGWMVGPRDVWAANHRALGNTVEIVPADDPRVMESFACTHGEAGAKAQQLNGDDVIFHKCTKCPAMIGPDKDKPHPPHYRAVDLKEEGWVPDGDGWMCPECSGKASAPAMWEIKQGNCLDVLRTMPDQSVHCVVTSPPYFGLRDYGVEGVEWPGVKYAPMAGMAEIEIPGDAGCEHAWEVSTHRFNDSGDDGISNSGLRNPGRHQSQTRSISTVTTDHCSKCGAWRGCLGLEPSVEMYIGHMVAIFREVRRVLRDDGTVWLNIGDSYVAATSEYNERGSKGATSIGVTHDNGSLPTAGRGARNRGNVPIKNLRMIPARLALALQADGWYVRSDIIWSKPSSMPESVEDRPSKSHEYIYLLSKKESYYYDSFAIREQGSVAQDAHNQRYAKAYDETDNDADHRAVSNTGHAGIHSRPGPGGHNKPTVWSINPLPFDLEMCRHCEVIYAKSEYKRLKTHVGDDHKKHRVCRCGQWDGWTSHFAVFPPSLPELCIKAGTSERGCCATCGRPWERVIQRRAVDDPAGYNGSKFNHGRTQAPRPNTGQGDRHESIPAGWRQACKCDSSGTTACTVLDLFFGAGTTGVVGAKLGRRVVGIEANRLYAKMAEWRILRAVGAPDVEKAAVVKGPVQMAMFAGVSAA